MKRAATRQASVVFQDDCEPLEGDHEHDHPDTRRAQSARRSDRVAPNTDQAQKYGVLITSKVISSAAANTFYLGRPWHNSATAKPQTVIRDTELPAPGHGHVTLDRHAPEYSWRNARLFEYHSSGPGAGVNSNRPQLTDAQASDYTVRMAG